MKNVNSFSAAERAIDYEYKRQIRLLESGGTVEQETRRWDDVRAKTIAPQQRRTRSSTAISRTRTSARL